MSNSVQLIGKSNNPTNVIRVTGRDLNRTPANDRFKPLEIHRLIVHVNARIKEVIEITSPLNISFVIIDASMNGSSAQIWYVATGTGEKDGIEDLPEEDLTVTVETVGGGEQTATTTAKYQWVP